MRNVSCADFWLEILKEITDLGVPDVFICVCVCVCSLFNDAVSNSDCIALIVNCESVRIWKEVFVI
jgi:hypothetical protein